jgi:hypothetical protein
MVMFLLPLRIFILRDVTVSALLTWPQALAMINIAFTELSFAIASNEHCLGYARHSMMAVQHG